MSSFLVAVSLAALFSSGALIAASLRLRSVVGYLLATFLVSFAALVLLVVALSPFHLVLRGWLVGGSIAIALASLSTWFIAGRPRAPSLQRAVSLLSEALRDPPLAIFATVVALGLVYLTALSFGTPPNSWDAMWYHLARAAFWKQQHAIGYVPDANDPRLNANPPVAEIGALYTMVVASTDRFVAGVSLAAYCAATLSVFGIARRLQLERRAALFGGLVFASLPVIVLQASGALNDLVLAAFLASAVYFLLGTTTAELALGGLSVALALATKFSAVLLVPFVILAGVLAPDTSCRRARSLSVMAALIVGSGWYFVNIAETGAWDGRLAEQAEVHTGAGAHDALRFVARTIRLLLDFVEVPGATGWWAALYAAGIVAAVAFLWSEASSSRKVATKAIAAAAIALSPLAILALGPVSKRGYQWVFFHLGRPDLGILDQDRGFGGASALASFYGPLGVLLLAAGTTSAFVLGRRALRPLAIVFGAAPVVFAAVLAFTLGYDPYLGRFFMFPMALAAASAGIFVRKREVVWSVVAVAAVTLVLTLRANDEKPPNVWGQPRWWVQSRVGGRDNGELRVIRFAEESVPARARIGLAIRPVDWSYPFFGARLGRNVRFVRSAGSAQRGLDWLVVAPTREEFGVGWTRVFSTHDGWRVFSRAAP